MLFLSIILAKSLLVQEASLLERESLTTFLLTLFRSQIGSFFVQTYISPRLRPSGGSSQSRCSVFVYRTTFRTKEARARLKVSIKPLQTLARPKTRIKWPTSKVNLLVKSANAVRTPTTCLTQAIRPCKTSIKQNNQVSQFKELSTTLL